jgi:hypothetical protein
MISHWESGASPVADVVDRTTILLTAKTDALRARLGAPAIPVDKVPFVVGRIHLDGEGASALVPDLLIEDSPPFRLSRQHFMITRSGEQPLVSDLGSTLGTIVNGQAIGHNFMRDTAPLVHGENDDLAGGRGSLFEFVVSVAYPLHSTINTDDRVVERVRGRSPQPRSLVGRVIKFECVQEFRDATHADTLSDYRLRLTGIRCRSSQAAYARGGEHQYQVRCRSSCRVHGHSHQQNQLCPVKFGQDPNGTKVCLPSPPPKRGQTMKEFSAWVQADVSRKDDSASVAFLRFMAGRFPCT